MPEQGLTPRERLEQRLIAKATKDLAFREALLERPATVLNGELDAMMPGVQLPDTIEVRVVEETPTRLYIVLPPRPRVSEASELTDEELAVAAGAGRRPPGGSGSGGSMCALGPGGLYTLNFSPC